VASDPDTALYANPSSLKKKTKDLTDQRHALLRAFEGWKSPNEDRPFSSLPLPVINQTLPMIALLYLCGVERKPAPAQISNSRFQVSMLNRILNPRFPHVFVSHNISPCLAHHSDSIHCWRLGTNQ
jgi:hypothetical protein